MAWLKILTEEDLFSQLESETAMARPATRSGCALPADEECTAVAWSPALPRLPAMKDIKELPQPNQAMLKQFRNWLHLSGYGPVGRLVYGHAVRIAFSVIAKDWRDIDCEVDLDTVHCTIREQCTNIRAMQHFLVGLELFAGYLYVRQQRRLLPRGQMLQLAWPATSLPEPVEPDLSALLDESDTRLTTQSGCVPMKPVGGIRRKYIRSSCLPPGVQKPLQLVSVKSWSEPNNAFYQHFRNWLHWSGYSLSALYLYGLAVRMAFSLISKDWREWDTVADLDQVCGWVHTNYIQPASRDTYLKGLDKLAQYLRLRQAHRVGASRSGAAVKAVPAYPERSGPTRHPPLTPLPAAILESVCEYRDHCRRNWPHERAGELGDALVVQVTKPLRWLVEHGVVLQQPQDLTPQMWLRYVDERLEAGIRPVTINCYWYALSGWLRWRKEQDLPVDARILRMKSLKEPQRLPKDVALPHLRALQTAIVEESMATQTSARRRGTMDLAWFLLMLHSGLRTGEIRRLKFGDIDWSRRLIRIEQSKGLKDRFAPMSPQVIEALNHYLVLREREQAVGDADHALDQRVVFIDRHVPLSTSYCGQRLKTYGERCGVKCTPHQLRHSCATLLLNSGMPIVSVQAILGHKFIETTIGYARLYDGTLAADYTRAMLSAEHELRLGDEQMPSPLTPAQLVALADSLRTNGTLNEQQLDVLAMLRAGLVQLAPP